MTGTGTALTLQVSDGDEVLEPYTRGTASVSSSSQIRKYPG